MAGFHDKVTIPQQISMAEWIMNNYNNDAALGITPRGH